LWRGSAESFVDLHPPGWDSSALAGVSGDIQVGIARPVSDSSQAHAALWRGSAESLVDLTPTGFNFAVAWAAAGDFQVGYGYGQQTRGQEHALLWKGTAESMVDLHQFLPSSLQFSDSQATAIAEDGTIVGYAGQQAILWTPVVPEPTAGVLVACGLICLFSICRRRE
jgi:hypothetical protein